MDEIEGGFLVQCHLQAGPDSKVHLTEIVIHPAGNPFLVIWEYPHSWRWPKLSSLLTWVSVAKLDLANSNEGTERSKRALGLSFMALTLQTYFLSLMVFNLVSVTASEKPHTYKPVKMLFQRLSFASNKYPVTSKIPKSERNIMLPTSESIHGYHQHLQVILPVRQLFCREGLWKYRLNNFFK